TKVLMRAAFTPRSPCPSRDLERTSIRLVPSASGRTRMAMSSWKPKSRLVAIASRSPADGSRQVTVRPICRATAWARADAPAAAAAPAARGLDDARHPDDDPREPAQREEDEGYQPPHHPEPGERRPDHEERPGDHPEGVPPARSRRPVVHCASFLVDALLLP